MNSRTGQAPDRLKNLVVTKAMGDLTVDQFLALYIQDKLSVESTNQIYSRVDPRNGEPIIYNAGRALRPHDYPDSPQIYTADQVRCPICDGNTTTILDWIELSEGFSFISKNMYPVAGGPFPPEIIQNTSETPVWGLHFVQWTSSFHDRDWHNMPLDDCLVVMKRLANLERKLQEIGRILDSRNKRPDDQRDGGSFVSIIKNVGAAVGGSLEHGHQQIFLSNLIPRRILDDSRFFTKQGVCFSAFIQDTTPKKLVVEDYGPVVLLVPEFMRRPFEMILAVKNIARANIHELNQEELEGISRGWKDACSVFQKIMLEMRRETAYNIITHNSLDRGLYFEFLPYTQEQGGLENLGLSVCQAEPDRAAHQIRQKLM